MKIIIIIISTIFCLSLLSCAGHCIKVGGTYQGVQGNVEYCFSQEKTDINGISTVVSGDSEKVLVEAGDLEKLIDKVESVIPKSQNDSRGNLAKRLQEALK